MSVARNTQHEGSMEFRAPAVYAAHQALVSEDNDHKLLQEQAHILLCEVTSAALALGNTSATGTSSSEEQRNANSIQQRSVTEFQSLLVRLLEFGIKTPSKDAESEAIGSEYGKEVGRDRPVMSMIRDLKPELPRLNAHAPALSELPTDSVLPSASPNTAPGTSNSDLQGYVSVCYNTRVLAPLLSEILAAQETIIADWYHTWAPLRLRSSSLEDLLDALEALDSVDVSCAHHACGGGEFTHACAHVDTRVRGDAFTTTECVGLTQKSAENKSAEQAEKSESLAADHENDHEADGTDACACGLNSSEAHGCASSHDVIEDACTASISAHSSPDSNASHQTHAAEIVEEPHACTDADTSQFDDHSFDIPDMLGEASSMHGLHASCSDTEGLSNTIPAVPAAVHVAHAFKVFGKVAEGAQEHTEVLSPPSMQPFGSVSDVGTPKTALKEPTAFQKDNISSHIGFQTPDDDVLDTVALSAHTHGQHATHRVHERHASSSNVPEASYAPSPCLPSPSSTTGSTVNKRRASIDVVLFRHGQIPANSNDPSRHDMHDMHMHAMHEPTLPCSSSAGAQLQQSTCTSNNQFSGLHRMSAGGGSLNSSFSSPCKRTSSHVALGRHHSMSLSQELFHNDMHACSRSMRHSELGFSWPFTAEGAQDVRITVGEFYVIEGSTRGRRHAEFEVATRVAGREVARVTRRFRQIRTLQQQLRGSYRGGNLDLFLPSPGEGVLPASWAEITRAAVTTIGAARTAPSTLAGRRALLQRCLSDLVEQRPHLLQHAAALEFLGLRRRDPVCMGATPDATFSDPCIASHACSPGSHANNHTNKHHPNTNNALGDECSSCDVMPGLGGGFVGGNLVSQDKTFNSTAEGALLGGLTLGQEPPIHSSGWRSRSTSPTKSIHRSPAKTSPIHTPNSSTHFGGAYAELVGSMSMNLDRTGSDMGFEKPPMHALHASLASDMYFPQDLDGVPQNSNRHFKMIMHEPHELQLSQADLARRQQGMCMGCMRTLGAIHEVMHDSPVDTWRHALQSSSLMDPGLWRQGSLGGRALETLGSIQNFLTPKQHAEKPKRCHYDGGLYCELCHAGQVSMIPSKIVNHWDFRKLPVSIDAYDFLQATRSHPVIHFNDDCQEWFFKRAPLLRDTTATRRRIATLMATLSEPSASVSARDAALRIRISAGHRAHLIEGHELWSVLDLQDLGQGAAFAQLPGWLARFESLAGTAVTNAVNGPTQRPSTASGTQRLV